MVVVRDSSDDFLNVGEYFRILLGATGNFCCGAYAEAMWDYRHRLKRVSRAENLQDH